MEKIKTNPSQQASEFVAKCCELGWRPIVISSTVIAVTKEFTPGSREGLLQCDREYSRLLALCPHKGGSEWGTECSGVGCFTALERGLFLMQKSGRGAKRFSEEVRRLA